MPSTRNLLFAIAEFDSTARVVGGAIRDLVLGQEPKDVDVVAVVVVVVVVVTQSYN